MRGLSLIIPHNTWKGQCDKIVRYHKFNEVDEVGEVLQYLVRYNMCTFADGSGCAATPVTHELKFEQLNKGACDI